MAILDRLIFLIHTAECTVNIDTLKAAREQQLHTLLGKEWIGKVDPNEATILCGDFNLLPNARVYSAVTKTLHDTQIQSRPHDVKATFFTRLPTARIDYIFVDKSIQVTDTLIPNTELTRIASDHFPLITDLIIS